MKRKEKKFEEGAGSTSTNMNFRLSDYSLTHSSTLWLGMSTPTLEERHHHTTSIIQIIPQVHAPRTMGHGQGVVQYSAVLACSL